MASGLVQRSQSGRQHEAQAECLGEAVAGVAEHGEGQRILSGGVERSVRRLRRDRDELGAKRADVGKPLLVGAQFQVAVRAPAAAVEHEHQRLAADDGAEIEGLAERIAQTLSARQSRADADDVFFDAGAAQRVDVVGDAHGDVAAHAGLPTGAEGVEFLLEGHDGISVMCCGRVRRSIRRSIEGQLGVAVFVPSARTMWTSSKPTKRSTNSR